MAGNTYHSEESAVVCPGIRSRHRANPPMAWSITGVAPSPTVIQAGVQKSCSDRGGPGIRLLYAIFSGPNAFGPSLLFSGSAHPLPCDFQKIRSLSKCQPHEKWLISIPCRPQSPGRPCAVYAFGPFFSRGLRTYSVVYFGPHGEKSLRKQSFPDPPSRIGESGPHLVRRPETTKGRNPGNARCHLCCRAWTSSRISRIVSHASLAR